MIFGVSFNFGTVTAYSDFSILYRRLITYTLFIYGSIMALLFKYKPNLQGSISINERAIWLYKV